MVLRNIAFLFIIALAPFSAISATAQEATPANNELRSENYLPADTRAWVSIPSTKDLSEHIAKGQLGKLAADPALKPFFDNAAEQIRQWLDNKQIGFDVRLDQFEEIDAGEVCIAGVLPETVDGKMVPGSHGVVLLADVSKDLEGAKKLVEQIQVEQARRGAKKLAELDINGIKVDKWEFANKRKWAKRKRVSLQAIVGNWILLSDNERIFRSVLQRIIRLTPDKSGNLANRESFKLAMKGCELPDGSPNDVRWYVEPFGYVKLARAIEIQAQPVKKMQDDWTAVLAKHGLRAIRSIAGTISVATDEKEALVRIFVLAPKDKTRTAEEKRMLSILDFAPNSGIESGVPVWVPGGASGTFTGQWNFSKALAGIGPIVDSFMKEEGAFKGLLDTIRKEPDFRVDIPKIVSQLDNKYTIVSAVKKPLKPDSELLAVGLKLKPGLTPAQQAEILASIGRAVRGKEIDLGGIKAIEDDRTEELEELDFDEGPLVFDDEEDKFGDADGDVGGQFALFEKKYISIAKDTLFVCNDKRYLKQLLTSSDKKPLRKAKDFLLMKKTLEALADPKKVSAFRFGRVDRILELNYSMLQKGELPNTQSIIGRVLNELVSANVDVDGDGVKFDLQKLPADYSEIAKYLGTVGFVLEDEQSGWRITGCVLKKE